MIIQTLIIAKLLDQMPVQMLPGEGGLVEPKDNDPHGIIYALGVMLAVLIWIAFLEISGCATHTNPKGGDGPSDEREPHDQHTIPGIEPGHALPHTIPLP